ncbi:kelch repeat-containing protein [Chloroflexus sp.]|uniref:kelch repeat-containing protein n=1 Tax=Chloroflexus sp. TaxID=1904827 RepID=UPI003C771B70
MTNESPISEREREILRLVATGATNQQIAVALNISVNTVKVHLRNIFAKIGVESRTEATVYAIRNGIVTVGETGTVINDETLATGEEPVTTEPVSAPIAAEPEPLITKPSATEVSSVCAEGAEPVTTEPVSAPTTAEPEPLITKPSVTEASPVRAEPVPIPLPAPELTASTQPQSQAMHRWFWPIGLVVVIVIASITFFVNTRLAANPPVPVVSTTSVLIDSTQRWFIRQPLDEPRDHFALAGYDLERRLYVIGGIRNNTVVATVDRYDPDTNRWVTLTDKPTAVSYARAITLRGQIFVPGGEDENGTVSDRLEIYDPREQRWYSGAPLPAPRSRYALVAWEGQLYLIGGWDGTTIRAEVFIYDPVLDRWETGPSLPQPRQYAGVTIADGRLYLIGGEGSNGPLRESAWLEPPNSPSRRWMVIAPLPQAIARPAVIGLSNALLVFDSERRESLSYDIAADAWSKVSLPADAQVFPDAVLLGQNVYFVGDSHAQGTLSEYRALYVIFIPGQ